MNSRFHEATKHEDEEEIDVDAVDLIRIKPIFIYFALLPVRVQNPPNFFRSGAER